MAIALNRNGKFAFSTASTVAGTGTGTINTATFVAIQSNAWTDVGRVRDFGEIGDSFETIDDVSIDDPRMKKFNTVSDGGTTAITFNYDNATTNGQKSLQALNGQGQIGFRYIEPVTGSQGGGRTLYWAGTISEWKEGARSAGTQQTSTAQMNVNTAIFSTATA